jgi:hypothetical protein
MRRNWYARSRHSRRDRRGFLTVEWILLLTVLVIGLVGGLALVRDAVLDELKDMACAVSKLTWCHDQQRPDHCGPEVCPSWDPTCDGLP